MSVNDHGTRDPVHTRDRMLFKWHVSNMDRWLNQFFAVQTLLNPHLSRDGWLEEISVYGRNIDSEHLMGDQ